MRIWRVFCRNFAKLPTNTGRQRTRKSLAAHCIFLASLAVNPAYRAVLLLLWLAAWESIDAAAPPVEDFTRPPEISSMQISPSGEHIAFIREIDGKRDLTVSELATGKATAIELQYDEQRKHLSSWLGKPEPREFRWLSTTRVEISTNVAMVRYEKQGPLMYSGHSAVDFDGGNWRDLPGIPVEYDPSGLDFWWDTKRIIVSRESPGTIFVRGKREPWRYLPYPDLFKIDTTNARYTQVVKNPGKVSDWILDVDDTPRFGVIHGRNSTSLLTIPANGFAPTEYTDLGRGTANAAILGLTRERSELYVARADAAGRGSVSLFNLAQKTWKTLLKHERYDVVPADIRDPATFFAAYDEIPLSTPVFSPEDGTLLGVRTVTDGPHQLWLTARYTELQQRLDESFKGMVNVIVSLDRSGDKMVALSYSARDPGSYWYGEAGNKRLRPLGRRMSWINPAEMGEMYPMRIPARDGLELDAYVTLPPKHKERPLPLVVLLRSAPWRREVWGFNPFVQFLAARGYAVLQVNHRGSTGYGAEFAREENRDLAGHLHDDVTDAVEWVIRKTIADPSRIALVGDDQFGGFCALAGLAHNPGLYRCGVAKNPVPQWEDAFAGYRNTQYWEELLGFVPDQKAFERLKPFSAKEFSQKINAPLLIIHDNAWVATLPSINVVVTGMKSRRRPVETFFYDPSRDPQTVHKNLASCYRRIEEFLAHNL